MKEGSLNKLPTLVFYVCLSFLFTSVYSQEVSAQDYDLNNDEFSLMMPGKPEYNKQFAESLPNYHAYRVNVNNIDYFFLLMVRNASVRKGYEHQLLSLKGHSIGYNAGFIQESNQNGIKVNITLDRDLKLNGFPGRQYRIVSGTEPGGVRFYVTDRFIYTLQVLGASETDDRVKEFFGSFTPRQRRR
ncbi:MAG: hypothetical protein ACRD8U_12940 [Pyrinomonadaceae bacterium]